MRRTPGPPSRWYQSEDTVRQAGPPMMDRTRPLAHKESKNPYTFRSSKLVGVVPFTSTHKTSVVAVEHRRLQKDSPEPEKMCRTMCLALFSLRRLCRFHGKPDSKLSVLTISKDGTTFIMRSSGSCGKVDEASLSRPVPPSVDSCPQGSHQPA